MLARHYYSELRRCLGPDDSSVRHLQLLADRASDRFADIADKIAFLLIGKEGTPDVLRDLSNSLRDVLSRLCSRDSAAYSLGNLAAAAKLGFADVVGVVGLLHSELEHVAQTTFPPEEAHMIQAALGRRAVMELGLLYAPIISDSRIVGAPDPVLETSEHDVARTGELAKPAHEKAARRLAHEVRNALNGAVLHLTFLERKLEDFDADDEAMDAAQIIGREIARVASLIDESLQLERDAGSGESLTSVKSLCTQALRQVSPAPDQEVVRAANGRARGIESVLLELMQDITEAALQYGGKVLLTARSDGGSAVIEIEHGALSDSEAWSSANTGFAMAMQTIADRGGSLRVETGPGRTTFHVQFPSRAEQQIANDS